MSYIEIPAFIPVGISGATSSSTTSSTTTVTSTTYIIKSADVEYTADALIQLNTEEVGPGITSNDEKSGGIEVNRGSLIGGSQLPKYRLIWDDNIEKTLAGLYDTSNDDLDQVAVIDRKDNYAGILGYDGNKLSSSLGFSVSDVAAIRSLIGGGSGGSGVYDRKVLNAASIPTKTFTAASGTEPFIILNGDGNDFVINLPQATAAAGKQFIIENRGTQKLTINTFTGDSIGIYTSIIINDNKGFTKLICDGISNWVNG